MHQLTKAQAQQGLNESIEQPGPSKGSKGTGSGMLPGAHGSAYQWTTWSVVLAYSCFLLCHRRSCWCRCHGDLLHAADLGTDELTLMPSARDAAHSLHCGHALHNALHGELRSFEAHQQALPAKAGSSSQAKTARYSPANL